MVVNKLDELLAAVADTAKATDVMEFQASMVQDIVAQLRLSAPTVRADTLGTVIRHLYDYPSVEGINGRDQAAFLHYFVWGGRMGDDETEHIKEQFVRTFGTETAFRLCQFVLRDHPHDILGDDGFTVDEMSHLTMAVVCNAIFLLLHEDLPSGQAGVRLAVDSSGAILGWWKKDHPSVEPDRDR